MKTNVIYKAQLLLLIFSTVFFTGNAQTTVNPSDNKPVDIPATTYPSSQYFSLANLINDGKVNYKITVLPDAPYIQFPSGLFQTYPRRSETDYFDGLGRPLQSVELKGNANGNDIVTAHVYDEYGRESFQYLPFAAPLNMANDYNALGTIKNDVNTQMRGFYDQAGHDEPPYGQTIYDNSPLNKVIKEMAPGRSWVGSQRGITYSKRGNGPNEVRIWNIDYETTMPASSKYYDANKLTVLTAIDEDGKKTIQYRDQSQKLILEKVQVSSLVSSDSIHEGFACTYYVYDITDHLRCVIPPAAVSGILNIWNFNSVPNYGMDLCTLYYYDNLGRLSQRKIPGKDIEYYVYDKRNRLIMFQDGNLRSHNSDGLPRWAFTFYDAQNRVSMTAICTANENQVAMQSLIDDSSTWPTTHWLYYFKNYGLLNTYPSSITACKILTYNYYDDYSNFTSSGLDFDPSQFANVAYPTNGTITQSVLSKMTRGLLTGQKVKVIDPDNNNDVYLTSVNYYDDRSRLIQTQGKNIEGGTDISSKVYYYQGTLYQTITHHENPVAKPIAETDDGPHSTIKITTSYGRNFLGNGGNSQIKNIVRKIDDGIEYPFAHYFYDHLGRIVVKQTPAGNILTEYNMRGFINHIYMVNSNNQDNLVDPDTQIFEENLYYDKGFQSQQFNGNVAGITWHMKGNNAPLQAYGYTYDNLNRLTYAEYQRRETPSDQWNNNLYDYTASTIAYDLNGNILSLKQRGPGVHPNDPPITMDSLTMSYAPFSNQLIKVEDKPDLNPSLPDFKNNASLATEFTYDNNGNLMTDANKALTTPISYTYLDKPQKVEVPSKGNITYVYNALGDVIQKKMHYTDGSGTPDEKWDYIGSFVYKNDTLQEIETEEGRARPVVDFESAGHPTKYLYDYFVKDHLGNVRSTVTANPINHNYLARHELVQANVEQLVFDNIPNVRGAKPGSTDPDDNMAARLDGGDPNTRVGTAILLSIMPGDQFAISADAFYDGDYQQEQSASGDDIVSSLASALMGGANYDGVPLSEIPANVKTVQTIFSNPNLAEQINNLTEVNNNVTAPRAHLNYLVFDNRMNLVSNVSGSVQVPSNIGGWTRLTPGTLTCDGCTVINQQSGTIHPQTPGYLLVYIDNQSIGKDVWFDNITIEHYTGGVLEENHYYPYGLALQLDQSTGATPNSKKYQSIQLEKHFGLETYETFFRGLNPQIGRFNGIDPKSETQYSLSPYASMANNPAMRVDPLGDENYNINSVHDDNFKKFNTDLDAIVDDEVVIGGQKHENPNYIYFNLVQAANMDVGRNDKQRNITNNSINGLLGTLAVGGVAPLAVIVGMEGAPILYAKYLYNPAIYNVTAFHGLMMAGGYMAEVPELGALESAATKGSTAIEETVERNVFNNSINLTTSSTSTAPAQVYTIYESSGKVYKFGVTQPNLIRYGESLTEAGPGAYGELSHVMTKSEAHLSEKYLRSLYTNSTGNYFLNGMKKPYPINFSTGIPIKPPTQ